MCLTNYMYAELYIVVRLSGPHPCIFYVVAPQTHVDQSQVQFVCYQSKWLFPCFQTLIYLSVPLPLITCINVNFTSLSDPTCSKTRREKSNTARVISPNVHFMCLICGPWWSFKYTKPSFIIIYVSQWVVCLLLNNYYEDAHAVSTHGSWQYQN